MAELKKIYVGDNSGKAVELTLPTGIPDGGQPGDVLVVSGDGSQKWESPENLGLPDQTISDMGQLLTSNGKDAIWTSGGSAGQVISKTSTGVEWSDVSDLAGGVPVASSDDDGKILMVDSDGVASWQTMPMPTATSDDGGKILTVGSDGSVSWEYPKEGGRIYKAEFESSVSPVISRPSVNAYCVGVYVDGRNVLATVTYTDTEVNISLVEEASGFALMAEF